MTNAESGSLGEELKAKSYGLPRFQRSYSWNRKHIEDLIDDLEYLLKNEDVEHYFDSIIIYQPESSDRYQIVDGQQRITTIMLLFSSVRSNLTDLKEKVDEESEEEAELETLIAWCDSILNDPPSTESLNYKPDEEQIDIYEDLILKERENPDIQDCESPSTRNMVINYEVLDDWVLGRFEKYYEETDNMYSMIQEIRSMMRKIRENISVSLYIVGNRLEANRMFEVVNDRGKNVNEADKIKSYLTYYSSINEDKELVDEINSTFNDLYNSIGDSDVGKVDQRIDRFISEHWRIFSGRTDEVGSVHERLKKRIDRETDHSTRGEKFVKSYLQSLRDHMGNFSVLMDDVVENIFEEDTVIGIKQNKTSLYVCRQFGPRQTIFPYVTELICSFDENDLSQTIGSKAFDQLEGLVICYYNLLERRNDFARTELRKAATDMEWSRLDYDADNVFDDEDSFMKYKNRSDSIDEAVKKAINKVDSKMSKHDIGNALSKRQNILDGDEGSTGVDEDLIKFILHRYEYDKYLQQLPYSEDRVKVFHKNKSDTFTLEHVLPQSLDNDYSLSDYNLSTSDEHSKWKNNLGNLSLLSINRNMSASNKPYKKKSTNAYQNDDVTSMISEGIVNQYNRWTVNSIKQREKEIINYISNTWNA